MTVETKRPPPGERGPSGKEASRAASFEPHHFHNQAAGATAQGLATALDREPLPWASRRDYVVRLADPADHPAVADGAVTAKLTLTITRLCDGRIWLVSRIRGWRDSDAYAVARIHAARVAALRMQAA